MSRSSITIKVLRQNFIKKHQLHPDYFTLGEKQQEEDMFNDREMFYPRQFERKNHHNGPGKFVTVRFKNQMARHMHDKTKMRPEKGKGLKVVSRALTPSMERKESQEKLSNLPNYNTLACQPSFVKTQKLRKRVVSARESRNVIPKYAAYIMKPCNVESIKMEPRPSSAFAKTKSTELRKYSGFGLRKHESTEKFRRPEHFLQPWETLEDEY